MHMGQPAAGFPRQPAGVSSVNPIMPSRFSLWRFSFYAVLWVYAFFLTVNVFGAASIFTSVCDLWALLGVGGLLLIGYNPLGWLGGRRLLLGSLAFGFAIGRFGIGYIGLVFNMLPRELVNPTMLLGIVPPVLMLTLGMTYIVTIGLTVGALFGFVVGVPVVLFNQILAFENSLLIYRYRRNSLAGYIVRFSYWISGTTAPEQADDSKGARFAINREIQAIHNPAGMAFGHHEAVGGALHLLTDKHIFIQASTRAGKGVTIIIPHLLRYAGSAFVLDPKGENARATYRQRSRLNWQVYCLDPFAISGLPQARFNPLSRITPANMVTYSLMLGQAIVIGERDHWVGGAQQLVALVIMHVMTSTSIPAGKKDLVLVRRLLLSGVPLLLKEAVESPAADGLISSLASSFLKTPEKEFGSILSTAQRETEILDDPAIAACIAASGKGEEIDFADWHSSTMTVYLCLSAPRFAVFNRWLRLVLTAALDEMTAQLNPPPLPVSFVLDEIATLGPLPIIADAVGLAAGYGIQIVSVWQDNAQLHALYKGRWSSFIGNAGVRVVFNLDDYDTAEYWSKFIGSRSEGTYSAQVDTYGLSRGGTQGERDTRLLAPEELMYYFAKDQMLVLAQGARPIKTERVPYFRDQGLAGLWDDPRMGILPPNVGAPMGRAAAPPAPAAARPAAPSGAKPAAASAPRPATAAPAAGATAGAAKPAAPQYGRSDSHYGSVRVAFGSGVAQGHPLPMAAKLNVHGLFDPSFGEQYAAARARGLNSFDTKTKQFYYDPDAGPDGRLS